MDKRGSYRVLEWWMLAPLAASAACLGLAGAVPSGGWVLAGVGAVFAALGTAALVRRWFGRPSYTTRHGIDVFPGPTRRWSDPQRPAVEDAVDRAVARWSTWAGGGRDRILAYMADGGTLTFTDQVIVLSDGSEARGYAPANTMTVLFREDQDRQDVVNLVEHEAGHVCLTALGVDPREHHRLMEQLGGP